MQVFVFEVNTLMSDENGSYIDGFYKIKLEFVLLCVLPLYAWRMGLDINKKMPE